MTEVYRPPCEEAGFTDPSIPYPSEDLERRVCPNCRLYFDAAENSDRVFCGYACSWRHERGEYL